VRAARAADLKVAAIWEVLSPFRDRSLERRVRQAGVAKSTGATQMTVEAVEALALLGLGRGAYKLYPLVRDMITKDGNVVPLHCDRLLETAAGIAAAAGRQWDRAEEHFQTALQQADELPHRLEQPEVRRFYGEMLLARDAPGDGAKARELLHVAVTMYEALGMPRHLDMAQALLAGGAVREPTS